MIQDLGTVRPGTTLYIPFHTFDSNDPSASVTLSGLAATDIEIYKDGSTTQRGSDNGYTLLDTDGIDFDGITGIHGISINLADNSTAGFYAAGSQYWVVISSVTVDAATINFVLATFRIGYENAIINTTIATLSSQTSFTLTSGPAEDDALNGMWCIIHDVASAVQLGKALILDYTGSTKTVTLAAGTTFTAAASDNISIMDLAPLQPTTLGRTLDVSSGGEAGLDWANIGSPTTAVNLSATNIDVDQVVASVSGAVGSVTGNVGGNVTGSVGSVASGGITAASIASDAITAAKIATDAITAAKIAADAIGASELAADAVTEIQSGLATAANLSTVAGYIDTEVAAIKTVTDAIGATGSGLSAIPWNAAWDAEVQSECADALAAYDPPTHAELTSGLAGADDATLAAIAALNNLSAAQVNAEVDTALADINLDHLVKSAVDTDFATTVHLNSVMGHIADNGTSATFDRTTDSLEAQQAEHDATQSTLGSPANGSVSDDIASVQSDATNITNAIADLTNESSAIKTVTDKLDDTLEDDGGTYRFTTNALEQAPTGGSAPSAADIADAVWDEVLSGHLTGGSTGNALNAAGSAGDPWSTALPGAYSSGTAGKILGDNLNATVSSRSSHSASDVWAVGTRTLTSFGSLVSDVASAVWDKATSALTTAGSIGKLLVDRIDAAISSRSTYAGGDTSGTTTLLSRIVGTLASGTHNPQSGDAYARLGAPAGASVSADIAAVKVDTAAVKAKTDNLPSSPAAVGSAMTLTSGERTAIANEVEAQIIDDTDSEKVLTAITDKIAAVNPDLGGLTTAAIASAVWANAARTLTALDEDNTTLDIDATVRAALGMAAANMDTQLGDIPTNAELAAADDATLAVIAALNNVSTAQVQTAAAAALTAYDAPTHAELVSEINSVQSDIAGLNNISAAQVNAEVDTALADYDGPTRAEATADKDEVITQVNANETKIDTLDTVADAMAVQVDELHKIAGLDAANPMTVTPSTREAGAIELEITGDGETTTTVTRQ